jgi:hypothetical protein
MKIHQKDVAPGPGEERRGATKRKSLVGCRRFICLYLYYQKRCIFSIDNEWYLVIPLSVSGWPGQSGKLTRRHQVKKFPREKTGPGTRTRRLPVTPKIFTPSTLEKNSTPGNGLFRNPFLIMV